MIKGNMKKTLKRKQLGKENDLPSDLLSNSLLENIFGDNIDDIVGRRSDVGKRSLCIVDADESITDVDFNDDQKEKEERKRQAEKEKAEKERTTSSRKPGTFSILSNLTQEELDVHYSKCIDMCNRNKVNVKNAFKLQLIDYMKLIVSNQSTKSENLTLMSCTLGASAKIYAHRVDKVYSDMVRIVSGKGEIEKEDSDNENATEDGEAKRAFPKKRRTSEDSSDDENAEQPDVQKLDLEKMLLTENQLVKNKSNDAEPQEKAALPRGLEYFVECRQIDPDGKFSLNPQVFPGQVESSPTSSTITINEPFYNGTYERLDPCSYIHNYKDIRGCFTILDEEGMREESVEVLNSSLAFDPSSNIEFPDSIMIDTDERGLDYGDGVEPEMCGPDYDEDDDHPEPAVDSLKSGQVSVVQPKSFSAEAMSRVISLNAGDYSFFDNSRIDFWAGPRHWSIKRPKAGAANMKFSEQPVKRTTKKSCDLEFSFERVLEIKKYYYDSPSSLLSRKTIMSWSTRRCKVPQEIIYSQKQLLSLMKNDELLYLKKDSKTKMVCSSEFKNEDETLLTPDDFEVDHDIDEDDPDVNFDDEVAGASPPLADTLASLSLLEGNGESLDQPQDDSHCELIPAPQRVQKIPIKYAKAQKKIDIKLLKSTIWENLNLEQQPKEESVPFSKVYSSLPEKLPNEEAAELSFPIAFMALLHMANEKSLTLEGNETYDDVSVSLG